MTDFLQRTALNHCRWCGMEDNRCGRHVLDHWRSRCVGDNWCSNHVFDHWRRRRVGDGTNGRHVLDHRRSWHGGVWQEQASWNVSWTDCVLNRSCLVRQKQASWKCVLTDRVLSRMRQGLPFLCVSSGSCTSCSGRSGSSLRKVIVHLCLGGWSCDRSVNKHIIPSTRGVLFNALAPHGPSGQARLLLPSARTHLAPVPTLRGNSTRCVLSWQVT